MRIRFIPLFPGNLDLPVGWLLARVRMDSTTLSLAAPIAISMFAAQLTVMMVPASAVNCPTQMIGSFSVRDTSIGLPGTNPVRSLRS